MGNGGAGGVYGGGGGTGGVSTGSTSVGASGAGAQGIIVVTYTSTAAGGAPPSRTLTGVGD